MPQNLWGYQDAHSGVGYAGIFVFSVFSSTPPHREYIQVELTDSIIKGIPYRVSFYVSLADKYGYAISSIGLFFSHTAISRNDENRFDTVPQVINPIGSPLMDKENWMLVSDTFISNIGGEKYITIGNFNDDSNSDTLALNDGSVQWFRSYYYVDDVSVVSLSTSIKEAGSIKFEVYPNPNNGSFTLQLKEPANNITITLYDAQGRKVFEKRERATIKQLPVNVTGIAPGVYSLCLTTDKFSSWKKVVVNP